MIFFFFDSQDLFWSKSQIFIHFVDQQKLSQFFLLWPSGCDPFLNLCMLSLTREVDFWNFADTALYIDTWMMFLARERAIKTVHRAMKVYYQIHSVSTWNCVVNSNNEFDPLEEVIVGRIEGATIPQWHVSGKAVWPKRHWDMYRNKSGHPFPSNLMELAVIELDNFASILEVDLTAESRQSYTHIISIFLCHNFFFLQGWGCKSSSTGSIKRWLQPALLHTGFCMQQWALRSYAKRCSPSSWERDNRGTDGMAFTLFWVSSIQVFLLSWKFNSLIIQRSYAER